MFDIGVVRNQFHPLAGLTLRFADVNMRVGTNSLPVDQLVRHYFKSYIVATPGPEGHACTVLLADQDAPALDRAHLTVVEPSKPGRTPKEAYADFYGVRAILKMRTGVVILVAEPEHWVIGDLVANYNQAVNAICAVFAKVMLHRGWAMIHAAATAGEDHGTAFAASSGRGKSTMALAMLEYGHRYVANDRLLVRPVGRTVEMIGLPKQPRINPGTALSIPRLAPTVPTDIREKLAHLSVEEAWDFEKKSDVFVEDVYGTSSWQLASTLSAIFMLNWDPTASGWTITTLSRSEARSDIRKLVKTAGTYDPNRPDAKEQLSILSAVADRVPFYEVEGHADIWRLAKIVAKSHSSPSPVP